jgi:hypothetical protein
MNRHKLINFFHKLRYGHNILLNHIDAENCGVCEMRAYNKKHDNEKYKLLYNNKHKLGFWTVFIISNVTIWTYIIATVWRSTQ